MWRVFWRSLGAGYLRQTLADGTSRRLARTNRAVCWSRRPNADMFIADTYIAPLKEGPGGVITYAGIRVVCDGHAALLNSVYYWRCTP